jgi:hypothetical protein
VSFTGASAENLALPLASIDLFLDSLESL